MSRNRVLAEQISNLEVAEALRTHASERQGILGRLQSAFEQDPRILSGWLWGSFQRGEADDLSDLDIWLLVEEEHCAGMGGCLTEDCRTAGDLICAGENAHNGPEGGGYLGILLAGTHGLHHIDLYWQPLSRGEVSEGPLLVSTPRGRRGTVEPPDGRVEDPEAKPCERSEAGAGGTALPPTPPPEAERESVNENVGRITFLWLMMSVAAKYLARDPASDMSLLSFPRPGFEEAVADLALEEEVGQIKWTTENEPLLKVDLLRQIAEKTAILERACQVRGIVVSEQAHPCLMSYFDLVAAILRAKP